MEATLKHVTNDAANPELRQVFRHSLGYAFVTSVLAGTGSASAGIGWAAIPVGTIAGAIVGAIVGVPVALVAATLITVAARPPATPRTVRRRIDVILVTSLAATAALAVLWSAQGGTELARMATAMTVVVLVCLVVARRRLHRLIPDGPT